MFFNLRADASIANDFYRHVGQRSHCIKQGKDSFKFLEAPKIKKIISTRGIWDDPGNIYKIINPCDLRGWNTMFNHLVAHKVTDGNKMVNA